MVGDRTWQKAMTRLFCPFTTATIRYFDHDQVRAARDWVQGLPIAHEQAMAA